MPGCASEDGMRQLVVFSEEWTNIKLKPAPVTHLRTPPVMTTREVDFVVSAAHVLPHSPCAEALRTARAQSLHRERAMTASSEMTAR